MLNYEKKIFNRDFSSLFIYEFAQLEIRICSFSGDITVGN
jgi:hypothetical protein